ncbi:nitrile hydratase subunit alpha [Xylophilus sp. GOD-11R]|uniref:nitrile hydratase subunit alpha n=1 Tax=Xylophilus sp. GOD-11R TaxID=3089814 RepID=UPI00298D008E|nr:nitrile hydratase subunit alpha [Xylophilus sp. GOD-11R]WPB58257.1 nitrile hydratase subunit alpha [Xylophilus sp. GOD-11R]
MNTAPIEQRVAALQKLTGQTGLVNAAHIDAFDRETHDHWVPEHGARLVARAWTDPAFKARLLADGRAAAAEFGIRMPEHHRKLAVRENTATQHNVICCTLCSCTAVTIVGMAPGWYKNLEYRARIVRQSRTVLRELGLDLPDTMTVQVWDTTADTRYMVLPWQPPATVGWPEERLRALVTQDALIGVARLEAPYAALPATPTPTTTTEA